MSRWIFVDGLIFDKIIPHSCEQLKERNERIKLGYDSLGAFPQWWLVTDPSEKVPGGILKFNILECPYCHTKLESKYFDIVDKLWSESELGKKLGWSVKNNMKTIFFVNVPTESPYGVPGKFVIHLAAGKWSDKTLCGMNIEYLDQSQWWSTTEKSNINDVECAYCRAVFEQMRVSGTIRTDGYNIYVKVR